MGLPKKIRRVFLGIYSGFWTLASSRTASFSANFPFDVVGTKDRLLQLKCMHGEERHAEWLQCVLQVFAVENHLNHQYNTHSHITRLVLLHINLSSLNWLQRLLTLTQECRFWRAMLRKSGLCCHAVSVRPFVTLVYAVKTNKRIFTPLVSHTILVFPHNYHGDILTGTHLTGRRMQVG